MSFTALPLEKITPEAFAPYGTVIDWSPELQATGQPFHVRLRETAPTGWRLGIYRVTWPRTKVLERHAHSAELYAPLEGCAAFIVAPAGEFDEAQVRAFVLDKPVCVGAGVWHGDLALAESALILIAENVEVTDEFAYLSREVGPGLG